MSDMPLRVNAVARVGTGSSREAGPAILFARRRPGYLGPVHALQLMLAEAAIVAVLALASHGVVLLIGSLVAAVALLCLTLSRREGRWWIERWLMMRAYRQRRRARPVPHPEEPRLTALRWLGAGLTVENVDARDGAQIGVARDAAGWFEVAAVGPGTSLRDDPRAGLPLDLLMEALVEVEQPGAVLQVVTHTVPAPSLEVDPNQPAGHSYRGLLQQFGNAIPVDRVSWVAVRLDARTLAEAGVDGVDEIANAPAAVATLIRRVAKALRRVRIPYQVLDASGLVDALARSCDLNPTQSGAPQDPREEWTSWNSGRLVHRSFWVADWPSVEHSGALLDWLSAVPSAQSSVALILAPEGDSVDLRCIARVSAPPSALAGVTRAINQGAKSARARLFQLDGEQAPAVYASAPTGGGPR